jgi:hypothetical protein
MSSSKYHRSKKQTELSKKKKQGGVFLSTSAQPDVWSDQFSLLSRKQQKEIVADINSELQPSNVKMVVPIGQLKIQSHAHVSMKWEFRDLPRHFLKQTAPEANQYFDSLTWAYNLLLMLAKSIAPEIADSCLPYDSSRDTVRIVERQMATVLLSLTERKMNQGKEIRFSKMLPTPESFAKFMAPNLQNFFFGAGNNNSLLLLEEDETDEFPEEKQFKQLEYPFSWRYSLTNHKLKNEQVSAPVLNQRQQYHHQLLVPMYERMERAQRHKSFNQLNATLPQQGLPQYAQAQQPAVIGNTEFMGDLAIVQKKLFDLSNLSTAVLEAKIYALAAEFQLEYGMFFPTKDFVERASKFKDIISPRIAMIITRAKHL